MAKLNRIAMDLLRKSNKPENIKGIVNKGYAYDYADYLVIRHGDELPEIIVNWITEKGIPQKTLALTLILLHKGMDVPEGLIKNICKDPFVASQYADHLIDTGEQIPEIVIKSIITPNVAGNKSIMPETILKLVLKMEMKELDVPEGFMQTVYRSPDTTVAYALQKYDYDPETELDPKIIESIMNGAHSVTSFIRNFLAKDLDVKLFSLEQWNAMADRYTSHVGVGDTVYVLIKKLIENGLIKNYNQINRRLIEIILKDSNVVNKFAHFILPYVKELPEEIKSKVTNQNVLKPDWKKVKKFDENFSSFFKKK